MSLALRAIASSTEPASAEEQRSWLDGPPNNVVQGAYSLGGLDWRNDLRRLSRKELISVIDLLFWFSFEDQLLSEPFEDYFRGPVGHRVQWDQLPIIVRLGDLNDTGLLAHLLGLTLMSPFVLASRRNAKMLYGERTPSRKKHGAR
jgi:hypothetical protein